MGERERAAELADPRVIAFPLRGEWIAIHSPGSRIPSHGTDLLAQRYAYDLIRLDRRRHYWPGSTIKLLLLGVRTRDCYGWGEPIHAPFDGEVVAAGDGVAERARIHPARELWPVIRNALTFRPTPDHVHRLIGNHVILRGDDGYASFAHLAPGSVAVEPGRRVHVGDVIGRVGHTGNSTAPHLHLQLMDGPDPLVARGLPCAFAELEIEVDGRWQRVTNAIPTTTDRIRSVG